MMFGNSFHGRKLNCKNDHYTSGSSGFPGELFLWMKLRPAFPLKNKL